MMNPRRVLITNIGCYRPPRFYPLPHRQIHTLTTAPHASTDQSDPNALWREEADGTESGSYDLH